LRSPARTPPSLGLGGEPLGLGVARGEHGVDRRPQRGVPLEHRQAQLVGEPRVARHLPPALRHVAELEEVRHPPVARLQLGVALAGRARGRDHLRRGGQPLVHAVRAPQRDVARVQRRGERARVARRPRRGDRLGADGLRARAVGRVVELDREARLQA